MFDDVHNIRDEPEVEFHMVVPEYSTYKDLHADQTIPAVTTERLQYFLSACYTNFNPKVADLYKGIYIQYVQTAAGQGPAAHCKHVITVLFALVAFCKNGELLTDLTCTQVLQTFHKSKIHKGSPLKLKNFHEATGKESGHKLYDPRTNVVNKDKIRKRHRDVIINWPISHVTESDRQEIELATRGQDNSKRWKQERGKRITSSNFGMICKTTERRDMEKLLSTLIDSADIHTKAIAHGRKADEDWEGLARILYE
ncbi:hypothetical protein Pmani_026272 [Petrolisthes manimaculis]|uniref:Uncharacterized protein n=1 Tax=Petrolisthes manimaculis TaxID=1843537 RepID=A0AAE1P3R6_9EUCA|nr:hypothetical protein Pmani_026272 [Petrolisthes manimaculis]